MKVKSNFKDFLKSFSDEVERTADAIHADAKSVAIEALRLIQQLSPVDTGRFRASHTLSLNTTSDEASPEGLSKSQYASAASEQLSNAMAKLAPIKRLKNGDKIYIQNNLDYAELLEEGHSRQAPSGVYAVTLEYIRRTLK